jgi:aryl-phospho-beta-D-glucosidase BglC (GH1 family)
MKQYNENVSEADMFRAWENIMARYGQKWNVFALDLKNEPHGVATWVRTLLLPSTFFRPNQAPS